MAVSVRGAVDLSLGGDGVSRLSYLHRLCYREEIGAVWRTRTVKQMAVIAGLGSLLCIGSGAAAADRVTAVRPTTATAPEVAVTQSEPAAEVEAFVANAELPKKLPKNPGQNPPRPSSPH